MIKGYHVYKDINFGQITVGEVLYRCPDDISAERLFRSGTEAEMFTLLKYLYRDID